MFAQLIGTVDVSSILKGKPKFKISATTDLSKLKFKDMSTDKSVMKRGEREYLPLEKGNVGRYFIAWGELMFLFLFFHFFKEKKSSVFG